MRVHFCNTRIESNALLTHCKNQSPPRLVLKHSHKVHVILWLCMLQRNSELEHEAVNPPTIFFFSKTTSKTDNQQLIPEHPTCGFFIIVPKEWKVLQLLLIIRVILSRLLPKTPKKLPKYDISYNFRMVSSFIGKIPKQNVKKTLSSVEEKRCSQPDVVNVDRCLLIRDQCHPKQLCLATFKSTRLVSSGRHTINVLRGIVLYRKLFM